MSDPSREKELEVALELERSARQQAEQELEELRKAIAPPTLVFSSLSQQHFLNLVEAYRADSERVNASEEKAVYWERDARHQRESWRDSERRNDDIRAQLTLSEQARAQAEQKIEELLRASEPHTASGPTGSPRTPTKGSER